MYVSVIMDYLVSKARTNVTGMGRLFQEAVLSCFSGTVLQFAHRK